MQVPSVFTFDDSLTYRLFQDLPSEIRKIATFLDVELSEDQVLKVATNCGFKQMQQTVDEGKSVTDENRRGIKVMNKGMY